MCGFLETTDGGLVSVTNIERISRPLNERYRARAHLVDGGTKELLKSASEIFDEAGGLVAAAPGWRFAMLLCDDSDGGETTTVYFQPIVAWRVVGMQAVPVTLTSDYRASNNQAVVAPDGQVFAQQDCEDCESVDQWIRAKSRSKESTKNAERTP